MKCSQCGSENITGTLILQNKELKDKIGLYHCHDCHFGFYGDYEEKYF